MSTYVAMERGSLFARMVYSFVKPLYLKNIEYQFFLMRMIGYYVEDKITPVLKIPKDALEC